MENTNRFANFDGVSDDSDHFFLDSNKGKCFTDSKSDVYRTIMKEWKILEQHLPESIYVRVYEGRIDLMRAAIVGAAGTPYHDGLFFFDIVFPSNYPKIPPKLYYHSFGYCPNPNLLPSGRVCLSLLNTWGGKKSEKWNPSGSTMLQVLLSIQALVLNDNPYYNDTAMAIDRSLSRSRAYNERVFLITCITSVRLLRKPPINFEAFVSAHFRDRAFRILSACSEYANGRVSVGNYAFDLLPSSSSTNVHVSRRFKKQMAALYPQLLQAFRINGASLEGLVEHLEPQSKHSENKSYGTLFKKVMKKIKIAFFGRRKTNDNNNRLESA